MAPGRQPRPAARRTSAAGGAPAERVRAVVEPVVTRVGYDVEELVVSRAGRRHLVRVVVDGDGGTSLDAIAEVSRLVSAALDAAEQTGGELIAGEYQLEVSSPGVDRPLTLPRQWRRNIGRLVSVRAGGRQLTGRIMAADPAGVRLDVAGTEHHWDYPELGPGRVQVEFTRLAEVADTEGDDLAADLDEIDGVDDDDSDGTGAGDADHGIDDEEREDEER